MSYHTTEGITFYVSVVKHTITATAKDQEAEFSVTIKNDLTNSKITGVGFIDRYKTLVVHFTQNGKNYSVKLINSKYIRLLERSDELVDEYNDTSMWEKAATHDQTIRDRDLLVRKAKEEEIRQQKEIIRAVELYKKNNPEPSVKPDVTAEIAALKEEVAALKNMLASKLEITATT